MKIDNWEQMTESLSGRDWSKNVNLKEKLKKKCKKICMKYMRYENSNSDFIRTNLHQRIVFKYTIVNPLPAH